MFKENNIGIIKEIENTMALEGYFMEKEDKVLIQNFLDHKITKEDAIEKILTEFKGE